MHEPRLKQYQPMRRARHPNPVSHASIASRSCTPRQAHFNGWKDTFGHRRRVKSKGLATKTAWVVTRQVCSRIMLLNRIWFVTLRRWSLQLLDPSDPYRIPPSWRIGEGRPEDTTISSNTNGCQLFGYTVLPFRKNVASACYPSPVHSSCCVAHLEIYRENGNASH